MQVQMGVKAILHIYISGYYNILSIREVKFHHLYYYYTVYCSSNFVCKVCCAWLSKI